MCLAEDGLVPRMFFKMIVINLPTRETTVVGKDVWIAKGQREMQRVISKVYCNSWRLLRG